MHSDDDQRPTDDREASNQGAVTPVPEKPARTAYLKLSSRYRRFVEHIVGGKHGADAARLSGCKSKDPKFWACRARARPEVKAAIAELEAEAIAEARERIYRSVYVVECIQHFDARKLVDADGNALPLEKWPDEIAAAVNSVEIEEIFEGRGADRRHIGRLKKYRVPSKIDAAKVLLQWNRQLSERHELTGKNGAPLPAGPTYVIGREEAKTIGADLDEKI